MSKNWDTTKDQAARMAIKHAPRIAAEFGANAGTQGALAGAEAGSAYGADVAGLAGAGTTSASGQGLSGMSAGGYASLAAPLIMTYLAYTGGSHMNTPLRKRNEIGGIGKYMTDLFMGKDVTPESNYGLFNPYGFDPGAQSWGEGMQGKALKRKYTPYEALTQFVIPNLTYSGGKEINAVTSPGQFYNYLRGNGITGDWLKSTLGTDLSEWADPNFDFKNLAMGRMKDLTRENARTAATSGDLNARKNWYEQFDQYLKPEEAADPNFTDLTMNPGVNDIMAQRQANPNWWLGDTLQGAEKEEWERGQTEQEMKRLQGMV